MICWNLRSCPRTHHEERDMKKP